MAGFGVRNAFKALQGLPGLAVRRNATAVAEAAPAIAHRPNARTIIPENEAMKEYRIEREHHVHGQNNWAWIMIGAFLPVLAYSFKYSYDEEMHHLKHAKEHPPQYIDYEYIRNETPLAMTYTYRTLFHNDLANPLPEGRDY